MNWSDTVDMHTGLAAMRGRIFATVQGGAGDQEMMFTGESGEQFVFGHCQDCCETVDIVDITGDLEDLVGEPLLVVEESSGSSVCDPDGYGTQTWTFYRFATRRGWVTVRWLGASTGYYSERVDLFVRGVPELIEK